MVIIMAEACIKNKRFKFLNFLFPFYFKGVKSILHLKIGNPPGFSSLSKIKEATAHER